MADPEQVTVNYTLAAAITELGNTSDYPAAANESSRQVKHNDFDTQGRLLTGETIDPEAVTSMQQTVTGTLDLTAAPKSGGGTQDLTNKALLTLILEAPEANVNICTIEPGATNPYTFLGTANGQGLDIPPGMTLMFTYRSAATAVNATTTPDVAPTVKEIDFTIGASSQLNVSMVFGNT